MLLKTPKRPQHRGMHGFTYPKDPTELRRRILEQDAQLLQAATTIAEAVSRLPASADNHPRALLVGGFVRDALLGERPKDLDMQIFGVPPLQAERLLHSLFPGRVARVGKQFEILKVNLGRGLEIDVSIPRRNAGDLFSPHESGDPSITPGEATLLRDFTVNSLTADPTTGTIHDLCDGLRDLASGIIRVTHAPHFVTRGLHVYRAIQITARLGFTVDSQVVPLLRTMVNSDIVSRLPARVVTEELKKLFLKGRELSTALRMMRSCGLLRKYYPELSAAIEATTEETWTAGCDRVRLRLRNVPHDPVERVGIMLAAFLFPLEVAHQKQVPEYAFAALAHLDFGGFVGAAAIGYLHSLHHLTTLPLNSLTEPITEKATGVGNGKIAKLGIRRVEALAPKKNRIHELSDRTHPGTRRGLAVLARELINRPDLAGPLESAHTETFRPSPLVDRTDLIKAFGLRAGPELGFLLGKVEHNRYRLVTKEAALTFLAANLDDFLREAKTRTSS